MEKIKKFTLFRFPIAPSCSPFIHQAFGKQFQISLEYTQTEVKPGTLQQHIEIFKNQGGIGANVTMPLKEEAYALCEKLTPRSQLAKSVNTLFWQDGILWGDNTDGIGFIRDITINHQLSLKNKNICIFGAGGAAAGIIGEIIAQAPKNIFICNRTIHRAVALQERFKELSEKLQVINVEAFNAFSQYSIDWFINATPSDPSRTLLPLDPKFFKNTLIYELSYPKKGKKTAFAEWAVQQGAKQVFDGIGMLVEQAAESFFVWTGKFPHTQAVIANLQLRSP